MNRIAPCVVLAALAGPVSMAKADLPILRLWPGGDFPCDTTLQACVSGANPGDRIRIETDGPIDESIAFSKSLALTAQAGFHPVFSAGRSITATTASMGAYSIRIEGLTLAQGTISVTQSSASPMSVDVVSNTVSNGSSSPSAKAIELDCVGGAGAVAFEVSGNTVTIDGSANALQLHLPSGSHGSIDNNSIAMGSNQGGVGISIEELGPRPLSADVIANRISGTAYVDGINIFGVAGVRLLDNLIIGQASTGVPTGAVVLHAFLGAIDATVVNNTITGNGTGIAAWPENATTVSGLVANNIVSGNETGISIPAVTATTTLENRDNLVFGNGADSFTPDRAPSRKIRTSQAPTTTTCSRGRRPSTPATTLRFPPI
ncbi:MAG TPA: right-handed parallel beta-helix repeat-containing protein [Solirubrobacteraceae bacterium]|nr:right-handed parallel beta-helix repeat-containing protein [Solirubrobacteraceae bacterium]